MSPPRGASCACGPSVGRCGERRTPGAPVRGTPALHRAGVAGYGGSSPDRGVSGEGNGWWVVVRKRNQSEVFRITGARQGLQEDVRGRQRRYVISMGIRTLSVILTVVLWNVERHVAVVTLIAGALLPYVAVVIANAGRESAPSLPSHFIPAPVRPALDAGNLRKSSDQS
ncbi:DUF3099 domain-containing protein [Streptomyces bambusae]|uniref:DUF3099 domain-containing protein n=1 Tax=Streptomyces bambusae TaxID=1550616 RepID=UPI0027DEC1DA|nr:DUF3099 domain-containing protein [Streptomyces bambusae]